MSADKPQEQSSRALTWILSATVLVALYVLSMGPVTAFIGNAKLTVRQADWLFTFYAPIAWLHDKTPLGKPLEAYQKWWWILVNS